MTDERTVIRSISWRDLFPWLILLRTFRIATQPSLLAVATAATLVMALGWWVSGWIFLEKIKDEAGHWRVQPPATAALTLESQLPLAAREYFSPATLAVLDPYFHLADPLRRLCTLNGSIRQTAYDLFGTLWSLAVWALAGGFITRYAILRLATEEEPALKPTWRYALRRYLWYLLTPLYPLLGVLLLAAPIAMLGWAIRVSPGAGSILVGMLWIFVALASLAAVWLLAGLIFGWPLMWPAISAERDGDPFEAFSRSFSYVYGKPLNYFFYIVVSCLFGGLCLAVVVGAATLMTEFGFWALAWGGSGAHVREIRSLVELHIQGVDLSRHEDQTLVFGSSIFALVVRLVRTVVVAYSFSFFWCIASALYLLMRLDVDEKEMDEVFVDEPPRKTSETVAAAPATAAPAPAASTVSSPSNDELPADDEIQIDP